MLEDSYSNKDITYMNVMYITVEPPSPRSNELFFLTPVIVEYKAIRKQKHLDIS